MKKHINIKISGKVQGVYFRASAKQKADMLGIKGIVRNEDDGSVYAEAEGEEKFLQQFTDWCHRGPERAAVSRCEISEGAVKGYLNFQIQR